MPIVSGFLTLGQDAEVRQRLYRELNRREGVTLGEPQKHLLPLVVASHSAKADREIWMAIARMDGVIAQHIVHADFQDLYPEPDTRAVSNDSVEGIDGGEQ